MDAANALGALSTDLAFSVSFAIANELLDSAHEAEISPDELIALLLVLIFVSLLALESPFIALENSRIAARMRAAPYRREHPPTATAEPIVLGLWDERKSVTALQLIVCLSLALGIDESHVMVVPEGSFFYRVTVTHEGAWVMEAINAEGSVFLDALNAQAARFGAQLVISHIASRADAPPSSPSSTTLNPG